MTWPTTPINTTNLDNGADEPRLARADIKNMADAVNAMIDYGDPYNPESPVPIPIAILTGFFNDSTYTVSSEETQTISNVYWYKKVDLIGLEVSVLDYVIIIPSGTFLFETNLSFQASQSGGNVLFSNISTGNIFFRQRIRDVGNAYYTVHSGSSIIESTGSLPLVLRLQNTNESNSNVFTVLNNGSDSGTDSDAFYIKITKIA